MKYLLSLIPLLLLFVTNSANATDYYYCDCQSGSSSQCVAGKDSNDGLSKQSPRQTLANANTTFNNFFAGDSIQFCRGGAFSTNIKHQWINNNCTSSNVCTVTSYDIPSQQNPQLSPPIITQQSNKDLFSLSDGGNADHEEGYTFKNLDLRCTGCTENNGWGFFLHNDIDYVTISNISINGFDIGVHLGSSNPTNVGSNGAQDSITLQNLIITNNKRQGILGGANTLTISDSYFENNGSGTVFDHNIYISRGNNMVIRGNELYRSSLDTNKNCGGVPLVVHGNINNLLIENNIIREDIGKANQGCWGIAIDPGYSRSESFTNITIKGNEIINVGNIGIGLASCDTCLIENNIILQQQAFGFTAIKAPDRTRDSGDLALNKITIRNNSIYTSSSGTGIILNTEGSQHSVVSNAIHYSGSSNFTCLDVGLAASAYTAIDNNICYFPNASSSNWEKATGTLSAWRAKGFGANSQNVNPGFKNPTLPLLDFSPINGAAAVVGAGHNTSSTKDFRGKTRDAQPDVGAFEYGTFNPPAKTTGY